MGGEKREKKKAQKIKIKNMTGVYYYESTTKRFRGKPDRTFYITYKMNGKRIWEKVGAISEKVTAVYASQIRGERLLQLRHGTLPSSLSGKEPTLNEAFAKFRDTHLTQSKHAHTVDNENRRYNKHIAERFGHLPLSKITPMDLEELKTQLLQKLAPQTVTHILGLIRQVYNKSLDWEIWQGTPPTSKLKMPKKDNQRVRYLSRDEAEELLNELRPRSTETGLTGSDQTHNMAMLSLHTGMRFAEIAKLRGENINITSGQIRIAESKNFQGRTIFLTKQCKEMFSTLTLKAGELVFPGRKGKTMERISRAFPRAVERLGFNEGITATRDKVVFHTLRHTFASWLAIDGTPLYVISQLLGHRSLEMTQRYAHLCPEVHQQAVVRLEEILNH